MLQLNLDKDKKKKKPHTHRGVGNGGSEVKEKWSDKRETPNLDTLFFIRTTRTKNLFGKLADK